MKQVTPAHLFLVILVAVGEPARVWASCPKTEANAALPAKHAAKLAGFVSKIKSIVGNLKKSSQKLGSGESKFSEGSGSMSAVGSAMGGVDASDAQSILAGGDAGVQNSLFGAESFQFSDEDFGEGGEVGEKVAQDSESTKGEVQSGVTEATTDQMKAEADGQADASAMPCSMTPGCPQQCISKAQAIGKAVGGIGKAMGALIGPLQKLMQGGKNNKKAGDQGQLKAQDSKAGAEATKVASDTVSSHGGSKDGTSSSGSGLISSTINPVDNGLFAGQAGDTSHALVGSGDLTETSFDKLGGVGSYNSNVAGSGYDMAANTVKNAGGGDGTTAGFTDDAEAFSASIGSATAPIDFGAMISGAMDGVGSIATSIGDFKVGSDTSSLDIGRALVPHLLQTFGADPAAMSDPQKKKPVPMEMLGFQPKNMLEVENRRTGRLLNWTGRIKLRYQYADPRGVPLVHGRGLLMAYYETLKTSNNPETTRALASTVGVTPPAASTTR